MTDSQPLLRRDTQETHDRLLSATGDLLAEVGPTFGLPELARRGGVGTATVYRHFDSIHDAYREFYLRCVARLEGQLRSVPRESNALRHFDRACEQWVAQVSIWGPASVHIRSSEGFLERVQKGDKLAGGVFSAMEPFISDLIEDRVIPTQDVDYASVIWVTLFDERVILDLRSAKPWPDALLALNLGRSVLAALGGVGSNLDVR